METKTRVLIADIDEDFRRLLGDVLSQEDDMECVGNPDNGVEALTLAAEQQPDVLVMDLVLLKLDGIEVLRRLRPDLVVERFAGEAPPRYHYGPGWGLVRNETLWTMLEKRLEELDAYQGEIFISLQEERAAGDVSAHPSRNP